MAIVRGRSMRPLLVEGDRLLVHHGADVRPGVLVLARFPDGTLAVKRAIDERRTASGRAGWWLLSENPEEGVDSRHRGPVPVEDVLAVAVARLWPRPGPLLGPLRRR